MIAEYLDKYFDAFGDIFPMYQLGRGRPETEIVKMIKECLREKKDVYEMGFLKEDDEMIY